MATLMTVNMPHNTAYELPDRKNPLKFSRLKQARVVAAGIAIIANSALGSSLPSGATSDIGKEFLVSDRLQLALLNSLYMLGFAIGPLIFGPLSEHIGRRPVLIGTFISYMIFTCCCAVSPNFTGLLIFRLLCGVTAAAPNAVVGPVFADIFDHPGPRGKVTAYYMCATSMVPPLGPIISGYATSHSWRLTFWIGLAIAGVFLPLVACLPETYEPIIRKKYGMDSGTGEKEKTPLLKELKIIFSRPFVMASKEPVVLLTSLYLALVYATLYLFFQAYPIIFQGVYGLSYSEAGLTFLPITAGSVVALGLFLWYSSYHSSAMKAGAVWAQKIENRRLPLACAGGPLQHSASAQAAASTMRSITAVVLPLAAPKMFENLGIQWACSLLGFFTLVLACIPFIFIRCGEAMRKRSPFCQKLAETDTPATL